MAAGHLHQGEREKKNDATQADEDKTCAFWKLFFVHCFSVPYRLPIGNTRVPQSTHLVPVYVVLTLSEAFASLRPQSI